MPNEYIIQLYPSRDAATAGNPADDVKIYNTLSAAQKCIETACKSISGAYAILWQVDPKNYTRPAKLAEYAITAGKAREI